MGYDIAKNNAWEELTKLSLDKSFLVKFLADEYTVIPEDRKVLSLSCNAPAKDFTTILILHYLIQKLIGLPELTGNWLSFKELSGIEGYSSAFRQRAIEPIIRKYGSTPEGLLSVLDRFQAKRVNHGDIGIVLEVFGGIPALITLWRPDEEFQPEANILFDKSIIDIFCIEDIVVLAGIVASQL